MKAKKQKKRRRNLTQAESGIIYGLLRELNRPQLVRVDMERNVLQAKAAVAVEDMRIPTDYLKEQLCLNLVKTLMDNGMVWFDLRDMGYGGKELFGSIAVVAPRSYGGRFDR